MQYKRAVYYWPQIPQSHLTAFITAQICGFMLYVLGLGLAICVLDSITARYGRSL